MRKRAINRGEYGEWQVKMRLSHNPKWTQEKLAEAAGIDQKRVSEWENGRTPSDPYAEKIARALGLDGDELEAHLLWLDELRSARREQSGSNSARADRRERGRLARVEAVQRPSRSPHDLVLEAHCEEVPPPSEPIIDRPEFYTVREWLLTDRDCGRIAIHGRPGIGKGALMRRLARDPAIRSAYPGGVWRVSLGVPPDLPGALAALARQLEIDPEDPPNGLPLIDRLGRRLEGTGPLLFVTRVHDVDQLEVFSDLPVTIVLVTRSYDLAHSFAGNQVSTLELLSDDDVRTFLDSRFQLSAAVRDDLVEATWGLPLRLWEIVSELAQRSRIHREAAFVERVKQGSWSTPRLEDAVRECLEGVADQDRATFTELAVFGARPAGFDIEAAAAVWGVTSYEAEERLLRLANANLVVTDRNGRFVLDEDLAGAATRELSVESQAASRHTSYYVALAWKYLDNLERVRIELPQLRRAWQRLPFDSDLRLPIARAAYDVQKKENQLEEAMNWTEQALAIVEALHDPDWEMVFRLHRGALRGYTGDPTAGQKDLDTALAYYQQREYGSGIVRAWLMKGELFLIARDRTKARECHDNAQVASRHEEAHQQLLVRTRLAWDLVRDDAVTKALNELQAIRSEAEALEDQGVLAEAWGATGHAQRKLGLWQRAEEAHMRSLELYKAIHYLHGQGQAYYLLGRLYVDWGNATRAAQVFEQALAIFQRAGADRFGRLGPALCAAGIFDISRGDEARARRRLQEALVHMGQDGFHRARFFARLGLWCLRLPRRWLRLAAVQTGLGLAPLRARVIVRWRKLGFKRPGMRVRSG